MAGSVDQETRDLIVALKQQVQDGFTNLYAKLDEMTRKHEGHETRIRSLEEWRSEIKGGARGIGFAANAGKILLGAVIGIAAMLGLQVVQKAPGEPETPAITGNAR